MLSPKFLILKTGAAIIGLQLHAYNWTVVANYSQFSLHFTWSPIGANISLSGVARILRQEGHGVHVHEISQNVVPC